MLDTWNDQDACDDCRRLVNFRGNRLQESCKSSKRVISYFGGAAVPPPVPVPPLVVPGTEGLLSGVVVPGAVVAGGFVVVAGGVVPVVPLVWPVPLVPGWLGAPVCIVVPGSAVVGGFVGVVGGVVPAVPGSPWLPGCCVPVCPWPPDWAPLAAPPLAVCASDGSGVHRATAQAAAHVTMSIRNDFIDISSS
jgi:hypothetical protein